MSHIVSLGINSSSGYFEKFCLPWPPTVNHYHQPARSGRSLRIIKSKKARDYAKKASLWIFRQNVEPTTSKKMAISITLHPPTRAKYDIDGRSKGSLDSLTNSGVITDDSIFDVMIVKKSHVITGGLLVIEILALDE